MVNILSQAAVSLCLLIFNEMSVLNAELRALPVVEKTLLFSCSLDCSHVFALQ